MERRVLASTVVLRGDVEPQMSLPVGVPSSVKGAGVVTRLPPAVGSVVPEGGFVVEVSGRPVFLFVGAVPCFRTMAPGVSGVDVLQLQAGLVRLGFPVTVDGVFGKATKLAVKRFYEAAGYAPDSDGGVPFGEVMFLPSMPAHMQSAVSTLGPIGSTPAGEGNPADDAALVRLSAGELLVAATVRLGDEGLVRVGMAVVLLDEITNATYSAKVTSVADLPVTDASGQLGRPAVITPDATLPAELVGRNVRVTITAAASDGEVLVVPLAAVSSAANGDLRVSVLAAGAIDPVDVAVVAGLSADGFVVVTPKQPGALQAGDAVVVGR